MIQRVQTVYLMLAAVLCVLLFFMPLASVTIPAPSGMPDDEPTVYEMNVFSIERIEQGVITTVEDVYWLAGINAVVLIFSITIIFLYKNRQLQMRLVRLCFLLVLILLVLAFYYAKEIQYVAGTGFPVEYKVADLFPILQLLFFHLANRAINKDEELVKSADRIR